jgi:predicted nucleic acid-binding protein
MKIYLDTSVLSAMFDTRNPERLEITKEFFAGRATDRLVVSELTLAEVAATPNEEMRAAMSKVADRCEAVSVTPDADRLATRYIEAGAVSESFAADAYHVAIAVVCGADVIVSWNFRHIV